MSVFGSDLQSFFPPQGNKKKINLEEANMSIESPIETTMLQLINAEREKVGAGPLTFNPNLNASAEDHSSWMLEQNIFSHDGEGDSTARERMEEAGYSFEGKNSSGENIATQSVRGPEGIGDDVQNLHDGLMLSPGHRANILNPGFDEIGIGIVQGDFTDKGTVFDSVMVTQNFASTQAESGDDDTPNIFAPTPPVSNPIPDAPDDDAPILKAPTVDDDDDDREEPAAKAPTLDDDDDDEPVSKAPTVDVEDDDDDMDDKNDGPGFAFRDEDAPNDYYVLPMSQRTHDQETYDSVIAQFKAGCDKDAFDALDEELQLFVLREFDCDFDLG